MDVLIHRFTLGQFECAVIQDGGRSMNVTERPLFTTANAEDVQQAAAGLGYEPQAVPFSLNILLVRTPTDTVLVDTGLGPDSLPDNGRLMAGLDALRVAPEAVNRVIITHGHGDHVAGLMTASGTPAFPNARYTMWQGEWDDWTLEANLAGKDPNNAARARKSLLPLADRMDWITAEIEIVPGIRAVYAPGHTLHHIAVWVESDGERLLHLADALHNPVQIAHTDWSPGFDSQPEVSPVTRGKLLALAAERDALLLGYHFPFPGLGRAPADGAAWTWQPTA